MMRVLSLVALALFSASAAGAQEAPERLSLPEAVDLALRHNPEFLARLNDEGVADWSVRSAYASFLPSVSLGGGLSYQAGGESRIGGFTSDDIGLGETPAYYYSSYSVGVDLGLDGSMFYRVGQEKANRRVVLADIDAAAQLLRTNVTRQYLAALRARDAVTLARQELERAEANLALAEARYAVQATTPLETRQAQVERGRAEVTLLRAEAARDAERLRLLQQIGVELDRGVELTTEVRVFEPTWELESLLAMARGAHPGLLAARASASAASAGVQVARSSYFPRLSLSTGLSGFSRRAGSDRFLIDQARRGVESSREECLFMNEVFSRLDPPMQGEDCSEIAFTDAMRDRIVSENRRFPFEFETEPVAFSLGVSLPVFQGLTRQRNVEAAAAQEEDARLQVRAFELRTRAEVETAHLNLLTAYRAVQLEERNRELARDQLELARERYRVGVASFLELMEAETLMAQADRAYLLGIYDFQEALTALEAAVGQDLAIPRSE